MNLKASRVDFIVIAYNEETNIRSCLMAILNQLSPGDRIIVVDDGSIDSSVEIVSNLASKNPEIQLFVHSVNLGRGAARQTGISQAQGTHIAFIDADILIPSNWLSACKAQIKDYAAVGGIAVPDGDVAVIKRISGARPREIGGSRTLTGNNFMIRRELLSRFPFPATVLGEDFRFFSTLERAKVNLKRIDGLVVEHREGKTYRRSVKWLFESGVDAEALLREFGEWRSPDIAARIAIASVALGILMLPWSPIVLAFASVMAFAITIAHSFSRFYFLTQPIRFLVVLILDTPLIFSYLLGRTYGLFGRWGRNG